MTERKPPGITFESWADRQIREATERGEFDDLPGTGKPLASDGEPYDELWWVKAKMRREDMSSLPPTLALRKEADDAYQAALTATTEAEARRIVASVNEKLREAVRNPPAGPSVNLAPFDVEHVMDERRAGGEG